MTIKTKAPISIEFDDEFLDAVAQRVIEKTGLDKTEEPSYDDLKFYTVKEIVQITQKSNLTIRNHIHAGLLQAKKVGKSFLVQKEDLQEYLTNQDL